MDKILEKIVKKRIETIKKKGKEFGCAIPPKRNVPIILPNINNGIVICEIKRGSPSEGRMSEIDNPVEFAKKYIANGANAISILTEEDFFYGSLNDLMAIKQAIPNSAVLRKDFLLSEEEVEISYRAGADIILLIIALFDDKIKGLNFERLKRMKQKANKLGLLTLIEVHNKEEYDIAKKLSPQLIGINSRDLTTFKIIRGYPYGLKSIIKNSSIIYESGIRNGIDSSFIAREGFDGILIGTHIIKSNNIGNQVREIKNGFNNGRKYLSKFYKTIFKRIYIDKKIVVKICGITNYEDALYAKKAGADILGFIFAKSPRQITLDKAKQISDKIGDSILKVGVVVDSNIKEVVNAVKDGWLDAIQFHGDIDNDTANSYGVSWYKALRLAKKEDCLQQYYSPIILFDAFSKKEFGGTGKQIDESILNYAKSKGLDLYLAGGINPTNIVDIVEKYSPLLIDISSGVEECPGKKDHTKIKTIFDSLKKMKKI